MNKKVTRSNGRACDQLRNVKITYDSFGYAPGSVLIELGNTKVLCSVSMSTGVPPFLKGKRVGWLTAEYAMLPTATHTRSLRDESTGKRNGRSIEISRLISRSLRAIVDLSLIGEKTITIDCDVLQADGGTRTAAITGSYLALYAAVQKWLASGEIPTQILTDEVAAVSVGLINGTACLDIDYAEDSSAGADYNFVLTKSGNIIEIQGTSERVAVSWNNFNDIKELADKGTQFLFGIYNEHKNIVSTAQSSAQKNKQETNSYNNKPLPLFSLKNRLAQ